jgi:hypothetical protein
MPVGTKISAQGVTVTFNAAAIGNIISFGGLDGAAADKDRTTLASTAKEYAPGLKDVGEFTLEVFRDNDDSGQAACLAALAAQTSAALVITLPTSTANVGTVTAYVKSIGTNGAVDDDVKGTIVFKTTGDIVWA